MKKILLIFPEYRMPFFRRVQIPLGLAYIAAQLEGHYDVEIFDAMVEEISVDQKILETSPDFVGISCLFTLQAKETKRICFICDNLNIPTIMGGQHATVKNYDAWDIADWVISGEGEKQICELLGIPYKEDVFPARHLLKMDRYFKERPHGLLKNSKRSTSLITSRGCPFHCQFCSIHPVWKHKFYPRSPESVLQEIDHLVWEYGIEEIQIEDDNFTLIKSRTHQILDGLIYRNYPLEFTTPNGIAIATLDRPILEKMRKAGFYRLALPFESGNQYVLQKIIKKPLNIRYGLEIVDICNELGFELDAFFVIGNIGETLKQMRETVEFAAKLKVDTAKIFIATPYPGTELEKIARENGFLEQDDGSFYKCRITTPEWTSKQVTDLAKWGNFICNVNSFKRRPLKFIKNAVKIMVNK